LFRDVGQSQKEELVASIQTTSAVIILKLDQLHLKFTDITDCVAPWHSDTDRKVGCVTVSTFSSTQTVAHRSMMLPFMFGTYDALTSPQHLSTIIQVCCELPSPCPYVDVVTGITWGPDGNHVMAACSKVRLTCLCLISSIGFLCYSTRVSRCETP
jgi:hypothetical protein